MLCDELLAVVVDAGTQISVPLTDWLVTALQSEHVQRSSLWLAGFEIEKQERKPLAFEHNHGDGDEE